MPDAYTVSEGHEFTYPADVISLRAIKDAGGISQMTDEQKAKLNFKTVKSGEDCSDMPEPARGIYLSRGWIIKNGATKPSIPEEVWKDIGRPPDAENGEKQ